MAETLSYRFVENTFYSPDWVELYVPLDKRGEDEFRKQVILLETRMGRRANKAELRSIATQLESAGL